MEITIEAMRQKVTAKIVKMPFFNPARERRQFRCSPMYAGDGRPRPSGRSQARLRNLHFAHAGPTRSGSEEFLVALRAQPVPAIGVADTMLRVVFRAEKLPSADQTLILRPASGHQTKVGGSQRGSDLERSNLADAGHHVALFPRTSVPVPVKLTEGLDDLTDILAIPPLTMNLNGLRFVAGLRTEKSCQKATGGSFEISSRSFARRRSASCKSFAASCSPREAIQAKNVRCRCVDGQAVPPPLLQTRGPSWTRC